MDGASTYNILNLNRTNKRDLKLKILKKPINFCAGNKLLQKNEKNWFDIHKSNELNSVKVEKLNKKIMILNKKQEDISKVVKDFKLSANNIIKLEESLINCIKLINTINELCTKVDIKLEILEDTIEEIHAQDEMSENRIKICHYQQEKLKKLESLRQKLRNEHDKRLQHYENQLRKTKLERQEVFQAAFQNDLALFEETGEIPKIEHIKESSINDLTLDEITLEYSDNDLENFLNQ